MFLRYKNQLAPDGSGGHLLPLVAKEYKTITMPSGKAGTTKRVLI